MNSEFLPAVANVATETAGLILGLLRCVATTSFDNSPDVICKKVSGCL